MSEEDRSRLYAWLREQTDEPLAEYLMSCLAPAPLSDLVTKDFLTAELSRELSPFATKEDLADLGAKVLDLDAKVALLVAQREEDRRTNRVRHYWLAGIGVSTVVSVWLSAAGVIA
ncbi:MAG: hypothetical protein OXM54_16185 [Acidimicrobiaceae bacterium]|nr:hypothetical protein [Acidimicrobiaceae bacterium]